MVGFQKIKYKGPDPLQSRFSMIIETRSSLRFSDSIAVKKKKIGSYSVDSTAKQRWVFPGKTNHPNEVC